MSVIEELKHLDVGKAALAAVFFMGFLAPGFLTVFALNQEIFLAADFFKLAVLSVAITSPSFLFLFITTLVSERVAVSMSFLPKGRLGGFKDWFITHSVSNATIFYTVLLIRFIFGLTTTGFIYWLASLLMVYVGIEFFRVLKLGRSENFDPAIRDPNDAGERLTKQSSGRDETL
jgi:hypothetical protein